MLESWRNTFNVSIPFLLLFSYALLVLVSFSCIERLLNWLYYKVSFCWCAMACRKVVRWQFWRRYVCVVGATAFQVEVGRSFDSKARIWSQSFNFDWESEAVRSRDCWSQTAGEVLLIVFTIYICVILSVDHLNTCNYRNQIIVFCVCI